MAKKKMRGFTKDGWVRVQHSVLRRVVTDRLQALLRGDFYVRNHLGEEDYEPIVKEVGDLVIVDEAPAADVGGGGGGVNGKKINGDDADNTTSKENGSAAAAAAASTTSKPQDPMKQQLQPQHKFTPELETFIQLIAASIMIDASMRGENAGESDTRFIKKKKKLLTKTLAGPKLSIFKKEVLRFDKIKRGETLVGSDLEEIVESEESDSGGSSEEESESEEEEEEEFERKTKKKKQAAPPPPAPRAVTKIPKKRRGPGRPPKNEPRYEDDDHEDSRDAVASSHPHQQKHSGAGESSSESEEEELGSDTATSNTHEEEDDTTSLEFSTSAGTSSLNNNKHQLKKEKKRMKKERKREKKRLKKEKRRREKQKEKEQKKLLRKKRKEAAAAAEEGGRKKKKRKKDSSTGGVEVAMASFADNELSDDDYHNDHAGVNGADDSDGEFANNHHHHHHHHSSHHGKKKKKLRHSREEDDEEEDDMKPSSHYDDNDRSTTQNGSSKKHQDTDNDYEVYEIATKEDFEQYKADLLARVPNNVKSRFREGGFSRWGKDWLPVLELGPFDVEPGPVRDLWLSMFDNTQESGRDMTRLVFWYGVKFEDRGQAYSFVPETKLVKYEEGERKGFCKMPKKIQKKIEKKQKLTKTEEQIQRGLKEIEADMKLDKSDRAAWMMQFKEDYELAEEEAAQEEEDEEVEIPKKRKPGRPKKGESSSMDKPIKRKPGRPKKVVEVAPLESDEEDEVAIPKKRKPGRPKKSEKEKAEKASAKAAAKAKKKESTAKKWTMVDEDQESEMETDDDEDDRDYDDDADSGDDVDLDVDSEDDDSDAGKSSSKKRKSSATTEKKPKKKVKPAMTEEEKTIERRAKAAEYREKKARERAEEQGIPYVKGRVGRKSKQTMLEEEQLKFTKCEEVFLPMMERLTEEKDDSNVKGVLRCINSLMERVELMTPPFLREYPLGMLVKTVRKAFEGEHPQVKDKCKQLTIEMKRVYSEKDKKIPDGFEPVKNKKSTPKVKEEDQANEKQEISSTAASTSKQEKAAVKTENIVVKSEKIAIKSEKVDALPEQSIPKRNNSEMSLSEPMSRKLAAPSSSECLPETVKSEPPQPKQKKTFSIKGMFEKPKPAPKPKIVAPSQNVVVSGQPSPKPKALPSWVTGPAMKMEDFHEQHAKERTFGLEFLVDAASRVKALYNTKRFDPISVSQSFELAIFAETKLRGRDWQQYWEKVHDVVAMLSPGKNKRNAILQRIISGDYQEPSELVKLSRREIQSLNQLKG